MDGLVGADVHVGGIAAQLPGGRVGQRGVAVCRVAGRDVRRAVALRASLCDLLLQLPVTTKSAAAPRDRFIGTMAFSPRPPPCMNRIWKCGGHGQQLAQVGFGLRADRDELLAAVAHLHHAHAAAVPVQHLGGGPSQHRLGHGGRAGGEVVRARARRRVTSWRAPWQRWRCRRGGRRSVRPAPWPRWRPAPAASARCVARVSATTFCVRAVCIFGFRSWYFLLSGELIQATSWRSSSSLKFCSRIGPRAPGASLHGLVAHDGVGLVEVLLELGVGGLGGSFALVGRHLRLQVLRAGLRDRRARLLDQPARQRFDAGALQVEELLDERGLRPGPWRCELAASAAVRSASLIFFTEDSPLEMRKCRRRRARCRRWRRSRRCAAGR